VFHIRWRDYPEQVRAAIVIACGRYAVGEAKLLGLADEDLLVKVAVGIYVPVGQALVEVDCVWHGGFSLGW
jgi:hypothetical protein